MTFNDFEPIEECVNPDSFGEICVHCNECGKWLKWADKDEQNLTLKRIDDNVLDKIRAEIEANMESIIGKYDSSIPKSNMPSYKIERNKARKECISIIDKYKADKKDCTTCIGFGDKDYAQSFCHDCVKDIQNHYKADKE